MPDMQDDVLENSQQITQELYKKSLEMLIQRRRVEQLLHSISEAIVAVDVEFKITLFNKTLEDILGITSENATGRNINELIKIRTEDNESIDITKYCFNKSEGPVIRSAILSGLNKEYFVNIKFSNVEKEELDPKSDECLITMTDITNEKMLDRLKDDFVSVAAHELRTPMTIIKSYLWMLGSESKGSLNDKQKDYISKAVGGTERLIALVNDMLDVSRIEQGRMDLRIYAIDIKTFMGEIESQFRLKSDEKGIYLKVEYLSKVEQAYADKNRLVEIFVNLLGNAIKFTDSGGITIKVEDSDNDAIKFSIIDTGKGIDKKDINRLFHKFGRLDNSYRTVAEAGGTGLGLYITKNLLEKMGGKIDVYSEGPGKGTTFWFTLPTKQPDTGKTEEVNSIVETSRSLSD
ncbi:MAG: PAS domain-containing sensor histidine kinase [Patescibacteria group bacterium]|jgi:PAS domain S-box-containing protein